MLTDAETLEIELEILEGCRPYFGLDLEVNGIMTNFVKFDDHLGNLVHRFELLPGKAKHLTLYLPFTRPVIIRRVTLTDGASCEPVPAKPELLLALGDSITQGMCARQASQTYAVQLAKSLNMELHYAINDRHYGEDSKTRAGSGLNWHFQCYAENAVRCRR